MFVINCEARNYITIVYTLNEVQKESLYTTFNHALHLMFIMLLYFSTAAGQWKPDYSKTTRANQPK